MRIAYVTQDTELWGGIAVVFQHLELLAEAGHDSFLATPAAEPDWYHLKVPIYPIKSLDANSIPKADIIVATSWTTVKPVVESKNGIPVHLCQGYEGDYRELHSHKAAIDDVYSYNIPKLTVSHHLTKFLRERFNGEIYYVGQMLDRDIFYPLQDMQSEDLERPFSILVVGPFQVNFKNIVSALKGIKLAKKRLKRPVRVIRVSQFPLSDEEKEIIAPDAYHFRVPQHQMGRFYRDADLFISMSKEAEGFGLPAVEAMACGVPTILSTISSYTSFNETTNYSLFVNPSDPQSLADAIVEISNDRSLRERLVRRGIKVAGKFTKENLQKRLNSALGTILHGEKLNKARKFWDNYHTTEVPERKVSWWDSPVIIEECQKVITGNPKMNIYQFLKKYLPAYPLERGLSICSGSGEFERGLLDNNICASIDAYEIAEERVKEGIRVTREKNYAINFHIEDVNRASFEKNHYDIFFSWSALHHIEDLEYVCENAGESLKDKGLIVVQEYIGPNQFQWTDKQIKIVNKILDMLPQQLRTSLKTGKVKTQVERPTIEYMNSTDPSEAIRSKDIVPVLERSFKIKAVRYFGNTICHPLFNEIMGNFNHNDEKDVALIRLIVLIEKILIEENILESDYAVVIAEKK